jgi:hypothetical protein
MDEIFDSIRAIHGANPIQTPQTMVPATPIPTAAPVIPMAAPIVPAAVTVPVAPTAAPTFAPAASPLPAVPVAAPSYTLDDLARAGGALLQAGKAAEAQALLPKYGIRYLNELKPEQYGAFAIELRALGAQI